MVDQAAVIDAPAQDPATQDPPAQDQAAAPAVLEGMDAAPTQSQIGKVELQPKATEKRGRPPLTQQQRQARADQLRQAREKKAEKKGTQGKEDKAQGTAERAREKSLPVDDGRTAADLAKCREAGRRCARSLGQLAGAASRYFGEVWRFTIFKNEDQTVLWNEPLEAEKAFEDLFQENNWTWWPGWLAALVFVVVYVLTRLKDIIEKLEARKNGKVNPKPAAQRSLPGASPAGHSEQPGGGDNAVGKDLLSQIPGRN